MHHPNLFKSALVADALNLGPHWVYMQAKLSKTYPQGVSKLSAPLSQYHPNKQAGDFTHYGANLALMLRSYAIADRWDSSLFAANWAAYWSYPDSYVDGATQNTLQHLSDPRNPASTSNDIAGASMALGLLSLFGTENPDTLIQAVRSQTAFSHGDPETIDTAEFFAHAVLAILDGSSIEKALSSAANVIYEYLDAPKYLAEAKTALDSEDHLKVAKRFGLTCHTPEAFPLTLYYLLRNPSDLPTSLSENALAGGDNSARAIIIAVLLTARNGWSTTMEKHWQALTQHEQLKSHFSKKTGTIIRESLEFPNDQGQTLSAFLELPATGAKAYAIFAHCFTCGKSSRAATLISASLARQGIATLRFDFTGLGKSEGDFSDTSFLTNTQDLVAAAEYLKTHYQAPSLLIGHSLGGAAVLATAASLTSVKAIATIGAPAQPSHVHHLFEKHLDEIRENGSAQIKLAGRPFKIGKRFLDDVEAHCQDCHIADLKRDLLILHAPNDTVVGIQNAAEIFTAAKHPKSFISLTESDHLLLEPDSAEQAADLIGAWSKRSLEK